jgi:uroporphyrinogen decarboxylase
MTSRDRVIRTLNHQPVDRAPRDLWLLPGAETRAPEALAELNLRFPSDLAEIELKSAAGKRHKASSVRPGPYWTDAWGCTWQLGPYGELGPLHQAPLAEADKIAAYQPPAEALEAAKFAAASRSCAGSTRFTLAHSDVQPLGRMQALRGPDNALADLTSGKKESRALLARLDAHFRRELDLWAATDVDAVAIHDPLGTAAVRTASRLWRQILKPLYRDYCRILHDHDKFAFFSSEGKVADFFNDLIEVGFDAIHTPVPMVDLEQLAKEYRGRSTFWIDPGAERLSPPATHEDVREEVRRVRRLLDFGSGVIARAPWGPGTPLRNVAAFFEEWMTPLPAGA